jgi:LysM repeat protein
MFILVVGFAASLAAALYSFAQYRRAEDQRVEADVQRKKAEIQTMRAEEATREVMAAARRAQDALAETWTDRALELIGRGDHLRGISALGTALRTAPVHDASRILSRILVTETFLIPREKTDAPESTYVIRQGDTLMRIAKRHRTDTQAIVDANDSLRPERMKVGMLLKLPRLPLRERLQSSKVQTVFSATGRWSCEEAFSAGRNAPVPLRYEQSLSIQSSPDGPEKKITPSREPLHNSGLSAFHPQKDLIAIADGTTLTVIDLESGAETTLYNYLLAEKAIPVELEWINGSTLAVYASISGTSCERWEVVTASYTPSTGETGNLALMERFQTVAEDIAATPLEGAFRWKILREGTWISCEVRLPRVYDRTDATRLRDDREFLGDIQRLNTHPTSLREYDRVPGEEVKPVAGEPGRLEGAQLIALFSDGWITIQKRSDDGPADILRLYLPGYDPINHFDYGMGFLAEDTILTVGAGASLDKISLWIQSTRTGRSLLPQPEEPGEFVSRDGSFLVGEPYLPETYPREGMEDFTGLVNTLAADSSMEPESLRFRITPVGLPPQEFLNGVSPAFFDALDSMLGIRADPNNSQASLETSSHIGFLSPFDAELNPSLNKWILRMKGTGPD